MSKGWGTDQLISCQSSLVNHLAAIITQKDVDAVPTFDSTNWMLSNGFEEGYGLSNWNGYRNVYKYVRRMHTFAPKTSAEVCTNIERKDHTSLVRSG